MKSSWTLEEGLQVTRYLERLFKPFGFHVALGGGVMLRGRSSKDLDVIVYPDKVTPHFDASLHWAIVADALDEEDWVQFRDAEQMIKNWRSIGSDDEKHVEVWMDPKGRRVDLIVMGL